MNSDIKLDLVDEMQFEDIPELFISLEDAGLEDKPCEDIMDWQTNYYIDEEH